MDFYSAVKDCSIIAKWEKSPITMLEEISQALTNFILLLYTGASFNCAVCLCAVQVERYREREG